MKQRRFYYRITAGIRITVRPEFLRQQSKPSVGQWIFSYAVRIENVGTVAVQLLSRHWEIHDSIGEVMVIDGDGVVGLQPRLDPGEIHEYQSYCILRSSAGHMDGYYTFVRADGSEVKAFIPRFFLDTEEAMEL